MEQQEEKGILVDRQVLAEAPRQQRHVHELILLALKYLYLLAASLGIAGAFVRTFQIPVNTGFLVAGLVLICLVYTAVYSFPKRIPAALGIIILLMIAGGFLFRNRLADGFGCLFNQAAAQVNSYYGLSVPLLAVDGADTAGQTISILYLMMIFDAILASGMIYYLDARVTALIMTFPLALALAVGLFPDMASSALMLFALVGIYFLQYTRQRESMRGQTVLVQVGSSMLSRLRWQTAALAAGLVLILFPVSYFQLGPMINSGYESQSELREDIRSGNLISGMREFWKKLMRGEWDWLPFDIIRSSGVHGGKLSNVKEVRDYDDLHLYLDISDDLFAPLYIRGYVGTNYTGNGWKEQTKEQKEAAAQTGMSVGQLSASYYQLLQGLQKQGNNAVYGNLRFVITNHDANSAYSYIPYGSDISEFEPSDAYDTYTEEKTDETILNMYYMNTQKLSNLQTLEEAGAASTADLVYRQYAAQTYLDVPQEGLEQFHAEFDGKTFSTAADAVAYVRTTLEERAEYTKTPGSTPKGNDYVEYFLYENRQGVCTQFASAAVLMFRTFGIPARYVEGYLTNSLTAAGGANEIYDRSAHAWVEIYLNGVGWIPVEVTPGFLNEEDMKDDRTSSVEQETISDVDNPETEPETDPAQESTEETEEETIVVETIAPTETVPPTTEPTEPTQPTTAPQNQPTQPPETTTSPEQQPDQKSDNMVKTILTILLIAAAIAVLIALTLFLIQIQYKKRLAALNARLDNGSPKEGILEAFAMIETVSAAQGLPLDEYTDWQQAMERYPFLTQETLAWLRGLRLEAGFSQHEFDEETRRDAAGLYRELAAWVLEQDGFWKRLLDRYLYCIG